MNHILERNYSTNPLDRELKFVLRQWKTKAVHGYDEWVTHLWNSEFKDGYSGGHYFRSYEEAEKDFYGRFS